MNPRWINRSRYHFRKRAVRRGGRFKPVRIHIPPKLKWENKPTNNWPWQRYWRIQTGKRFIFPEREVYAALVRLRNGIARMIRDGTRVL